MIKLFVLGTVIQKNFDKILCNRKKKLKYTVVMINLCVALDRNNDSNICYLFIGLTRKNSRSLLTEKESACFSEILIVGHWHDKRLRERYQLMALRTGVSLNRVSRMQARANRFYLILE